MKKWIVSNGQDGEQRRFIDREFMPFVLLSKKGEEKLHRATLFNTHFAAKKAQLGTGGFMHDRAEIGMLEVPNTREYNQPRIL